MLWVAQPGEGIVGGATEGTDMQSVFPMIAGGVVANIPLDADLLTIWVVQGAISISGIG